MLINDFLIYCKDLKKSEFTIKNYKCDLEKFYKDLDLNDEVVLSLKYEDFMNYINELQDKDYKATSINRKLSSISSFYSYLYLNKLVEENIIKRFKKLSVKVESPKFLEVEEGKKLLELVKKEKDEASESKKWIKIRDELIINILLGTGLRGFELENLKLEDIEIEEGRFQGRIKITKGKGNKSRIVIMPKVVFDLYSEWLEVRNGLGIDNEYVFVSQFKKQLSKKQVQNLITRLSEEVGITFTAHSLRHTFATNLVNNDVDIKSVQVALGHSSTAITEKVYVHATQKNLLDCSLNNPLF